MVHFSFHQMASYPVVLTHSQSSPKVSDKRYCTYSSFHIGVFGDFLGTSNDTSNPVGYFSVVPLSEKASEKNPWYVDLVSNHPKRLPKSGNALRFRLNPLHACCSMLLCLCAGQAAG